MQSVMHDFRAVTNKTFPRSAFNCSHGWKSSLKAMEMAIMFHDIAMPGDTMSVRSAALLRLYTSLKYPILDNVFVDTHYFAVPIWQIFTNFKRHMGETYPDPDTTIDVLLPKLSVQNTGCAVDSIWCDMGVRPGVQIPANKMHNLFGRANNWIWNTWIRRQDLDDGAVVDLDDGPDDPADYAARRLRTKRDDYITSCLPWPQKGDPVTIALAGFAPVLGIGKLTSTFGGGAVTVREADATTQNYANSAAIDSSVSNQEWFVEDGSARAGIATGWPGIFADMSGVSSFTIESMREAILTQQFLETDARAGTRYPELVWAHHGVRTDDASTGYPIYLGGSSQRINVHQVAQTSEDGTTPQGGLRAFSLGGFDGHGFTYSFNQHCVVLGYISIRADLTYQKSMPRIHTLSTRYDWPWPEFANLGEEPVLNQELFYANGAADVDAFGYQERFAWRKFRMSYISGLLHSEAAGSLDFMHLAADDATLPQLGSDFIHAAPPIERVSSGADYIYVADVHHDYRYVTQLPVYSVPGVRRF